MSKLGTQILEELQKHTTVKLPKFGIIAGQSVAEAFFRIKKIPIYTRIKDIDLFFVYNEKTKLYKKLEDKHTEEIKYLQKTFNMRFYNQKIDRSKDSSGVDFQFITNSEVSIVTNFDYENINFVGIKYFKEDFLKDTVNNFDINMIQIGVCLKTKRVYKTKEFESFLKSKQLEIINYSRPVSSLLRVIQKSNDFKGCYFNIDNTIINTIVSLKLFKLFNDNKIKEKNKIIKIQKIKSNGIKNSYVKELEKDILKLSNYNNNSLFNKFDNLPKDIKIKLKDYFNISFPSFNAAKIFEFHKDDINDNPSIFVEKLIHKNKLDIINNKFSILSLYNFDLNIFKSQFLLYDIENRNKKYISNLNDPLIKKYPDFMNQFENAKKDNRFNIIIDPKTQDFHIEDKEFKYNDYLLSKKKINKSIRNIISYKENIDLVKFSLKNKKALREINKKFNLFKKYFYSNKNLKSATDQILGIGLINKNLINFILKNDIESFLNLKIDKAKNNYQDLIKYFIIPYNENNYNDLKQTINYNLEACLRHPTLTFSIYNNKKMYTNITLNYIGEKIRFFEKKYIFIIGLFESRKLPLRLFFEKEEELEKIIKNLLEKKDKNSKVIIIPEDIIEKSINNKSLFYAKQIISKFELMKTGTEMKHCVGGHYKSLIDGSAGFFNIYYNKVRYTLKVYFKKNYLYEIKSIKLSDFKGKMNKEPDENVYSAVNIFIENLNKYYIL